MQFTMLSRKGKLLCDAQGSPTDNDQTAVLNHVEGNSASGQKGRMALLGSVRSRPRAQVGEGSPPAVLGGLAPALLGDPQSWCLRIELLVYLMPELAVRTG